MIFGKIINKNKQDNSNLSLNFNKILIVETAKEKFVEIFDDCNSINALKNTI